MGAVGRVLRFDLLFGAGRLILIEGERHPRRSPPGPSRPRREAGEVLIDATEGELTHKNDAKGRKGGHQAVRRRKRPRDDSLA